MLARAARWLTSRLERLPTSERWAASTWAHAGERLAASMPFAGARAVAQQTSRGVNSADSEVIQPQKTSRPKNTDSETVVCHSRGGKCVRGLRHLFKRGSVCVWPSSTRCRSGSSCTYTVCIVLTYSLQSAVSCYPDHLNAEVRSFPPSPGQRADASVASARPSGGTVAAAAAEAAEAHVGGGRLFVQPASPASSLHRAASATAVGDGVYRVHTLGQLAGEASIPMGADRSGACS